MSKQLTKTIMVPSTSGQASLNVAPGAVVSAPVNGDIWNEAGALKIKTPTTVKTLATTDLIPGAASRTHTIDLANYGIRTAYAFEVADNTAKDEISTMVEGDWLHVLADGTKYLYDGAAWLNMGSKDWTADPYLVGSNNELVLIVNNSNGGTFDAIMLNMQQTGTYLPGDAVVIISTNVCLSIIVTDNLGASYDNNTISRELRTVGPYFKASQLDNRNCFAIRSNSHAVIRCYGTDWSVEEPAALRVRGLNQNEDGFGNAAELASDGYLKRFTLNEQQFNDVERKFYLDVLTTGLGITYSTIADISLEPVAPAGEWRRIADGSPTSFSGTGGEYYFSDGVKWNLFANINYDLTVQPVCTGRDLSLPQYICGSNGENSLVLYSSSDMGAYGGGSSRIGFLILPSSLNGNADELNAYQQFSEGSKYTVNVGSSLDSDNSWVSVASSWRETMTDGAFSATYYNNNATYPTRELISGIGSNIASRSNVGYKLSEGESWTFLCMPHRGYSWTILHGPGIIFAGDGNGDGWGNGYAINSRGYLARYSLTEAEYRAMAFGFDSLSSSSLPNYVDIDIDTTGAFTYTCKPENANIIHYVQGQTPSSATFILPDSGDKEKWRFYFRHPLEPVFRTVSQGASTIDGMQSVSPIGWNILGRSYIEFISSQQGGWQTVNNSSKEERIFWLDVMTTGVNATDIGSFISPENVTTPVPGNAMLDANGKWWYYNGINKVDGYDGWMYWGSQNPCNPPYLCLSNGENRLNIRNLSVNRAYRAFVSLPGFNSGDYTEDLIAQNMPIDSPYRLDTSYLGHSGCVIVANNWTKTDWAIQNGERRLDLKYPSLPAYLIDPSFQPGGPGGFEFDANTHITFEPYLDDTYLAPGSRTDIRWNPTDALGVLFKRAQPYDSDGWGTPAETNKYGYVCRYTLSEKEYEEFASKLYIDVFTDTTSYTYNNPFMVMSEWQALQNTRSQLDKIHLVIDPSAYGTGGSPEQFAYFQLPSIADLPANAKITFKSKYHNGKDCKLIAFGTDYFNTGRPTYSEPNFPSQNWLLYPNRGGIVYTLEKPELTSTSWIVTITNVGGLDRKGWGNEPDWQNGMPERYTLTQLEYSNINKLIDPRILRGDTYVLGDGCEDYINRFSPAAGDIVVDTMVASISNGRPFVVYNRSQNYLVTLKDLTDGLLIGGKAEFIVTPGNWVKLVQKYNIELARAELAVLSTTQYQIPIPTALDAGKAIVVDSNGKYALDTAGSSGSRNIDGGSPDSIYLASQVINGGNP